MKKFFVLLKKEIRELLTPQMLFPLVMIVLVFFFIGKIAGSESKKTPMTKNISVMDLDKSKSSDELISTLSENGFLVDISKEVDKDIALSQARSQGKKAFVYIPIGFENDILLKQAGNLEVFYILKSFSFQGASKADLTPAILQANQKFSDKLIIAAAPKANLEKISTPLAVVNHTLVNDKSADIGIQEVFGFITSQATLIPIVLMLVITFASSLIALSIAQEKENKTLETLLSAPVSRSAIVASKLVAAGLIALLSAALYIIGLNSYIKGLTGDSATGGFNNAAIEQLGITMNTGDYLLLGGILFLGILTALSIALILGSFAEDSKSAQGVISPLMIMVLIPYFLVFFLDIETISPTLRWLVYAIPFSHVFLAAPNIMLGQYEPVIYGMIYLAALFILFIWIASRIFATDKILTIKLKFKRNKKDSI